MQSRSLLFLSPLRHLWHGPGWLEGKLPEPSGQPHRQPSLPPGNASQSPWGQGSQTGHFAYTRAKAIKPHASKVRSLEY